jgi:hypothetical protein
VYSHKILVTEIRNPARAFGAHGTHWRAIAFEKSQRRSAPMDRCKEYSCFALSFAGLGYIVLRLLTPFAPGGNAFGIAAHSPVLPPALNAIGAMAAIFAAARLLSFAVRRWRSQRLSAPLPQSAAASPLAVSRQFYRLPPPVKPRAHFGLRGVPR